MMSEFVIRPFNKSYREQVFNILMESQYDHYNGHKDYFLPPETSKQVLMDFLDWILNKRKNFGLVAVSEKKYKRSLGICGL